MALGDITAVAIEANGWQASITIEGFVAGGTYDFGLTGDNDPTSAKIAFTVTSEGYTAAGVLSTVTRTVYGVPDRLCGALRLPYPSSTTNHATHAPDETVPVSDLVVKVALSDFIYDDDDLAGNGVADITVTIGAAWYTNTGGSSETNAAATDFAVTNGSTLDYPKVVGQWDHIAGAAFADRVKTSFQMAANAYHRLGIACVRFDADGVSSSNNETETVTTQTAVQRSATGFYAPCYQSAAVALTSFNQGESINLRFRAYPLVGDADSLLDTDSHTTANEVAVGWNKATIICDKSDALDVIKYVGTGGTDDGAAGRGDSSGDPYATIVYALQQGANIIYLGAGSHSIGDYGTRVAKTEWAVIQPEAGQSAATVTVTIPNSSFDTDYSHLRFDSVTVTPLGTSSLMRLDSADYARWTNCIFDNNAVGEISFPFGLFGVSFFENCTGDLGSLWKIEASGTTLADYYIDGCTVEQSSGTNRNFNRMMCCDWDGSKANGMLQKTATYTGPANSNAIIGFNKFMQMGVSFDFSETSETTGLAIVGNVFEMNSAQGLFDMQTEITSNNIILLHNTMAGGRQLFAYDSLGTNGGATNWIAQFNLFHEFNCKGDVFIGSENGAHINGWPVEYCVGWVGNDQGTHNVRPSFNGIHSKSGSTPTYVDDASFEFGDNAGNGDYRDSVLAANQISYSALSPPVPIDLTGRTRPTGGTHWSGALLPVPNGVGATLAEV